MIFSESLSRAHLNQMMSLESFSTKLRDADKLLEMLGPSYRAYDFQP